MELLTKRSLVYSTLAGQGWARASKRAIDDAQYAVQVLPSAPTSFPSSYPTLNYPHPQSAPSVPPPPPFPYPSHLPIPLAFLAPPSKPPLLALFTLPPPLSAPVLLAVIALLSPPLLPSFIALRVSLRGQARRPGFRRLTAGDGVGAFGGGVRAHLRHRPGDHCPPACWPSPHPNARPKQEPDPSLAFTPIPNPLQT